MTSSIVQQQQGGIESVRTYEQAVSKIPVMRDASFDDQDSITALLNAVSAFNGIVSAGEREIRRAKSIEDVSEFNKATIEASQNANRMALFGQQRLGELLSELPKAKGNQYQQSADCGTPQKAEAIKQAGISTRTAYDFEQLAKNPDVVQAVIEKAEAEGRIVSRAQVLKAIKERDEARKELSEAHGRNMELGNQIVALERQVAERPEPEVIEREVVREVESQESKRRIAELERENKQLNDEYQQMWAKKRDADQRLQQANELLGENDRNNNARRDIEVFTVATNNYLRQYGGKLWAFDQFYRVDEPTQQEFIKAIASLAAFAQNVYQAVTNENKLGA